MMAGPSQETRKQDAPEIDVLPSPCIDSVLPQVRTSPDLGEASREALGREGVLYRRLKTLNAGMSPFLMRRYCLLVELERRFGKP